MRPAIGLSRAFAYRYICYPTACAKGAASVPWNDQGHQRTLMSIIGEVRIGNVFQYKAAKSEDGRCEILEAPGEKPNAMEYVNR